MASLCHRWHGDASLQIAADDMVLGRASDDDAFQRHVGVATARPAWRDLQNRLAADTKAPALDGRSGSRTTVRRRRSWTRRNFLPARRYIPPTRKSRQN